MTTRLHHGAPRPRVRVRLQFEAAPNGGQRITSPDLPGWAVVARTAPELARALALARAELDVRAYAEARGQAYDGVSLTAAGRRRGAPERRLAQGENRHDPAGWTPMPDGTWRAPGGGIWPATTEAVARVRAHLHVRGLPTVHPDDPAPVDLRPDLIARARQQHQAELEQAAHARAAGNMPAGQKPLW